MTGIDWVLHVEYILKCLATKNIPIWGLHHPLKSNLSYVWKMEGWDEYNIQLSTHLDHISPSSIGDRAGVLSKCWTRIFSILLSPGKVALPEDFIQNIKKVLSNFGSTCNHHVTALIEPGKKQGCSPSFWTRIYEYTYVCICAKLK